LSTEAVKHKTVNRAAAVRPAAAVAPPVVQTFANKVSSPRDPAEKEAEATAKKVMRMQSPYVARFATTGVLARESESLQRQGAGQPAVTSNTATDIRNSMTGGSPLPSGVRQFMEPRFRADFSNVKVHTSEQAARLSNRLDARAFTVGSHVFFGRDQFRPESEPGRELIAHELTHTIQQGSVIQRSEDPTVTQTSPEQVQRAIPGIGKVLDFFADWANAIPGFRMFTIVLGVNPINMSTVDRSPANVLRAVVEFMPGGNLITRALDNYGIFDRIGAWVSQQLKTLGLTGAGIRDMVMSVIDAGAILSPRAAWNRAEQILGGLIERIKAFLRSLAETILQFIKDAVLKPLAKLVEQREGYKLLKVVLGRDPITGESVPQDMDALLGAFMQFIGQEEVWTNLKKANAVKRASAWFKSAIGELLGFVQEIPGLFVQALKELKIESLVDLPGVFARVGGIFTGFAGRFISWGLSKVLSLLEIIFDVLAPSVVPYLRKAAAAFKTIVRNPMGFVGNLVQAAKLGFVSFGSNITTHLKAGLIDWLTGAMPSVYIPKSFTLGEIVKFVFSVLGISWQNVRAKLVKVIGETAVSVLETTFDIVVTLVTQGPAAAWEKIKDQLANLRDQVLNGIIDFVVDSVVKKAVPKIIAMFIPGAGFISAILSIVDTVQVFVSKLSQIGQVVASFINSISAIAAGNIAGAARRVESTLASLLSLAISFLAGFVGLGKVSDKVMGVIHKVRDKIDKAIDWLINWIVTMAKKLGKMVLQAGVPQDPKERLKAGLQAAVGVVKALGGTALTASIIDGALGVVRQRYGFQSLRAVEERGTWWVDGKVNPGDRRDTGKKTKAGLEDVKFPDQSLQPVALPGLLGDLKSGALSANLPLAVEFKIDFELDGKKYSQKCGRIIIRTKGSVTFGDLYVADVQAKAFIAGKDIKLNPASGQKFSALFMVKAVEVHQQVLAASTGIAASPNEMTAILVADNAGAYQMNYAIARYVKNLPDAAARSQARSRVPLSAAFFQDKQGKPPALANYTVTIEARSEAFRTYVKEFGRFEVDRAVLRAAEAGATAPVQLLKSTSGTVQLRISGLVPDGLWWKAVKK